MDSVYNKVVKKKRLQKLGSALVVLMPKAWMTSLNWTQQTELIVAYHPDERKIIITKSEANNEEISQLIDDGN